MKLTKLFAIVFCIVFSTLAHSGNLLLTGDASAITGQTADAEQPYELHNLAEFRLYNSNNFNVTVKLRRQKVEIKRRNDGTLSGINETPYLDEGFAGTESITISANSVYTEIFPVDSGMKSNSVCPSELYLTLRSLPNSSNFSSLVCLKTTYVLNVTWQDTIVTNNTGSLKSVTPITGTVHHHLGQVGDINIRNGFNDGGEGDDEEPN